MLANNLEFRNQGQLCYICLLLEITSSDFLILLMNKSLVLGYKVIEIVRTILLN